VDQEDSFEGNDPKVFFNVEKQAQVDQDKTYVGSRVEPPVFVSPQ
jgi:hypothetical protein